MLFEVEKISRCVLAGVNWCKASKLWVHVSNPLGTGGHCSLGACTEPGTDLGGAAVSTTITTVGLENFLSLMVVLKS